MANLAKKKKKKHTQMWHIVISVNFLLHTQMSLISQTTEGTENHLCSPTSQKEYKGLMTVWNLTYCTLIKCICSCIKPVFPSASFS